MRKDPRDEKAKGPGFLLGNQLVGAQGESWGVAGTMAGKERVYTELAWHRPLAT